MSDAWAASMLVDQAPLLAPLRLTPGIRVLDAGETVWLCGENVSEIEGLLRGISGLLRFHLEGDDSLRPVGRVAPCGELPKGNWTPIAEWFSCELPPTVWPGLTTDGATIRLVRSSVEIEATMLLVDWPIWRDYAVAAPQSRLERLAFAADRAGRALIKGKPLPPLPGRRLIEMDGVVIPAGWRWEPHVEASVIRKALMRESRTSDIAFDEAEDMFLFDADGSWEIVPGDALTQASRSAIRLTEGVDGRH